MPNHQHQHRGDHRDNRGHHGNRDQDSCSQKLLDQIRLKPPGDAPLPSDLFADTAEQVAKMLNERNVNQYTQVRKFYDELTMWYEKINQNPDRFNEYLPFVRMLSAKAAYAQGRRHLSPCFVKFLKHCLDQMDTLQSFRHGKLFFEAFMGYFRVEKNS